MRSAHCLALCLAGSTVGALATPAVAGPELTLPQGGTSATLALEVNASKGSLGSPTSIAPDVAYGVTDDVTVALIHSTFGTTGFRGGAGGGLCVSESCAHVYDNVGGEAHVALAATPTAAAALVGGIVVPSIDRGWVSAKVGAKLRAKAGRVTIASAPSILIAATHRDGAAANRDRLLVPLSALVLVSPPLSLGVGTGFKAPLDDVGGGYEVALGAIAQVALTPEWTAGASWVHGKIVGGDAAVPEGTSGVDFRAIQAWITYTR
jgi:hypothetical protein